MEIKDNVSQVTRCLRCGKPLRNAKAKQRGYGSHCYAQYRKECYDNEPKLFSTNSNNGLNLYN